MPYYNVRISLPALLSIKLTPSVLDEKGLTDYGCF